MKPARGVKCVVETCDRYADIIVDSIPVCTPHWRQGTEVLAQLDRAKADRKFEQAVGQEIAQALTDVICSYFECPERATKNLTVREPRSELGEPPDMWDVPYCDEHYEQAKEAVGQ